jgi:uncharacterized protein (DUF924 family)
MSSAREVLDFWFGPPIAGPPSAERLRFWFAGEAKTDQLIRERFAAAVEQAISGALPEWTATPQEALALILLLDQFPRNIYRHSPRAYSADAQALKVCCEQLAMGQDRHLSLIERAFFYLPLEHAEDLQLQERSVKVFRNLLAEAPAEWREVCESFLDYAIRHRDIIARFGRFPHRNKVLGRLSTAEEEAFLKEPGSSF